MERQPPFQPAYSKICIPMSDIIDQLSRDDFVEEQVISQTENPPRLTRQGSLVQWMGMFI